MMVFITEKSTITSKIVAIVCASSK